MFQSSKVKETMTSSISFFFFPSFVLRKNEAMIINSSNTITLNSTHEYNDTVLLPCLPFPFIFSSKKQSKD